MRLGFLGTRVARRFLAVNLMTALLPVAVLSVAILVFLRAEMRQQAAVRVDRLSKSTSLSTLASLTLLASRLKEAPADAQRHGLFDSTGSTDVDTGAPGHGTTRHPFSAAQREQLSDGQPVVLLVSEQGESDLILAIRSASWSATSKTVIWGRLHAASLFADLDEAIAADDASLCVFETTSKVRVHCDPTVTRADEQRARLAMRRTATDTEVAASDFLTATKSLFLMHTFAAPDWSLVVSRPASSDFASSSAFRSIFVLLIVAVLVLIFVVSHAQIRRTTEPLMRLKDATIRLQSGDFQTPVVVTSDDEFAVVASSFNTMASSLSRQITLMQELSAGTVLAFARAIDANSPWTAGHSERVTHVAMILGRALHLSDKDLDTLERGGLLHDIGKIAVPPQVLDKNGRLNDEEWEIMRRHPIIGCEILSPIPAFADALPIVRSHHERVDGTGYPDQLYGDHIPFMARILAVADVFDALASKRPYRDAMPLAKVCDIIHQGSGTHFDPTVVHALLDAVHSGAITTENDSGESTHLAATVARARGTALTAA